MRSNRYQHPFANIRFANERMPFTRHESEDRATPPREAWRETLRHGEDPDGLFSLRLASPAMNRLRLEERMEIRRELQTKLSYMSGLRQQIARAHSPEERKRLGRRLERAQGQIDRLEKAAELLG